MLYLYRTFKDGNIKKAKVQGVGVVSLDREGTEEEILKAFVKATTNDNNVSLREVVGEAGGPITTDTLGGPVDE